MRIGIAAFCMLLLVGCLLSACGPLVDNRVELLEMRVAQLEKNQDGLIDAIKSNTSAINHLSAASEKNSDSILMLAKGKK